MLNLLDMLLVLHIYRWRNLLGIQSNDPSCYTYIPNHILIVSNHMIHLYKYLIPLYILSHPRERARRRGDHRLISGSFWVKESPPSIMVTRKPNWSFRDSKARDWLRKGKVLAPLVRHTCLVFGLSYNCYGVDVF